MVKPAPAVKCEGETDAEKRPSPPLSRVLRARRGSCMSSASACGQSGRPRGRGASWRSGYAEDCKSLYGGSIPSEASRKSKIRGRWRRRLRRRQFVGASPGRRPAPSPRLATCGASLAKRAPCSICIEDDSMHRSGGKDDKTRSERRCNPCRHERASPSGGQNLVCNGGGHVRYYRKPRHVDPNDRQ